MSAKQILFPPGRYVGGSVYESKAVTDDNDKPKFKDDGKPMIEWSFAVAIPKVGADWKQTPWGQQVVLAATEGYPNGEYNAARFAWKITDGDSTAPNSRGNKPCDQEGFRGCWVIWFSSRAQAPRLTDKFGTQEGNLLYGDGVQRIKPGHVIQVFALVKDNAPAKSPGVYMNYDVVAHTDDTTPVIELRSLTDTSKVGFGGGGAPAANTAPANYGTTAPGAPAQTVVTPQPGMLAAPGAPMAPSAPLAPVAPVGPVMLPAANGVSYAAYKANGWTDEQLRQHQLMA